MSACQGFNHAWKPASIRIFGGEGKPKIEIMDRLKDETHPEAALQPSRKHLRTELPCDIFPPEWEKMSLVQEAILVGAAETNNHLVKGRTAPRHRCFKNQLRCVSPLLLEGGRQTFNH